jgi:hypothetical protein
MPWPPRRGLHARPSSIGILSCSNFAQVRVQGYCEASVWIRTKGEVRNRLGKGSRPRVATTVMSEKTKLINELVGVIERELAVFGIRKSRFFYTCAIVRDVSGWVGLNLTKNRSDGTVGINPIVGVRNESVESLVERLSNQAGARPAPTLSISLGYLMPEKRYLEWLFEPEPTFDYVSEAKKVATAIQKYGLPFMKANATLGVVIENLEHLRFSFKESAVYRLPAAYVLEGKPDLAAKYVTGQLEALGARQDDVALQYRAFGKALFQEVIERKMGT